jgi:dienelactone hydrolase
MPKGRFLSCLALAMPLLSVAQDGIFPPPASEPPVEFVLPATELGMFTSLANRVFKPAGASTGPLPVAVIGHTCGGVSRPHIRDRAKELLAAGYMVVAIDSYGPRGIENCRGQTRVNQRHQVRDAYAALDMLTKLPEVDQRRIYYTGYSAGGMSGPMLASTRYMPPGEKPLRFRAIVSNYASCIYQNGPTTPRIQLLPRQIDTPVLMLMAQEDKELRAADCFPQLDEMKAAGQPVAWHVYADVHHAWDQPGVQYTHTTGFGEASIYRYSASATADSTRRMLEFFKANQ